MKRRTAPARTAQPGTLRLADSRDGGEAYSVYAWPKNSREEVRASLRTFKGHRLADIRVYAADDEGDGDHPTRKGICMRVGDLPRLLQAVQALIEAERAG
jgi:hypothetical protein